MGKYAAAARGLNKNKNGEKESTSSVKYAGSAAASGKQESEKSFQTRLQKETKNLYSQTTGNARGAGTSYTRSAGGANPSPASTPVSTQPQGSLYAQIAKQMRGTQRPNLYSGTTPQSPAATAPLTQGSQYSQPQPAAMPGLGGAQRQAMAEQRNLYSQPAPSYFQLLERNIAAAAQDPTGVTPGMVAELRQSEQQNRERRQQSFRDLEREIAAQGNLNTQPQQPTVTPGLTGAQRQMIAQRGEAISEDAPLSEVKARLPGLQYTYEAAKQNFQQLMDRNMRLANETGEVPPDMVAELYRAEQARNQAEQRYNAALARNEELSYSERMGSLQTDVDGIAELLAQREEVNRNGFAGMGGQNNRGMDESRNELAAIDAQIEAVRESLRREGLSEDEIQSLFDYQVRLKNAEDTEALYQRYLAEAQGNTSFENWVMNTSMGLYSGASYIDLLAQEAGGLIRGADPITGQARRIDYNSELQGFQHSGEAVMQGEMDKLLEKYGVKDENGEITGMSREGRIRAGAYQLAVSMGQSAAVAGLQAVGVPAAMLLLSGNAATQTAHEMHEKGFSDGASLMMGAISGAAEYVTERIGMDQLFQTRDISTAKNVVKTLLGNIVNQSMAEGGEEVLSDVINTLADLIVNGDKSELASRYRELLDAGYTPQQAEQIAAKEWFMGRWQSFYMGALSGSMFSVGGTAFVSGRNAITDARTGRQIINAGTVQDVLDAAKKLDGKISDAAAMPEISDTPSARELGAAQRGLERAQVMENMRSELESRGEENVSPELLSALYNSSMEQEQRLTREEQKALRGSRTAMELAAEWSEQWGDETIPAPFEGLEDILRSQMEQKENAPQEGAMEAQEQTGTVTASMGEAGKQTMEKYTKGLTGAAYDDAVERISQAYQRGRQGEIASYQTAEEKAAHKAGRFDRYRITNAKYNKDAGLKKNDIYEKMRTSKTLTNRVARQIDALGRVLGVQVELVEDLGGEGVSGYYENGVIKIAIQNNADPLTTTAIHEAVHRIRETDPDTYNMLAGTVWQLMQENPETFGELFQGKAELYGQTDEDGNIKTGGIDSTQEEVTAQALGVVLSKSDMLEKLAARNRTGVQKLLDMVIDLLEKVRGFTNGDYQISREDAEGFRELENHMATLQSAMEKALENAKANTQTRIENAEQGQYANEDEEANTGKLSQKTTDKTLDQRVSGDQLLDAQDLIETVEAVGAEVDGNGYITLYHRTSPAVADKIRRTGRMTAREDGLFFSTKKEGGQNEGFGSSVIELKIPAEELVLDDIFDDEAHVKVPLPGGRWSRDVSNWIVGDASAAGKASRKATEPIDIPMDPRVDQFVDEVIANKDRTASETLRDITQGENRTINRFINTRDGELFRGKYTGGQHIMTGKMVNHIRAEHTNILKEALRASLPMTAEDIKKTLSAVKSEKGFISQPSKTEDGRPSIITTVRVNGYTFFAEEIVHHRGNQAADLISNTIWKAPTQGPTSNVPVSLSRELSAQRETSAGDGERPVPYADAPLLSLYSHYTQGSGEKSRVSFVSKDGKAVRLYFTAQANGTPVHDRGNGNLVFLSADQSNIQAAPWQSKGTGYVIMEKPFVITADNRVFKASKEDGKSTNVNEKVRALMEQGYDGFIFDYHEGDRYAVMVADNSQIISEEDFKAYTQEGGKFSKKAFSSDEQSEQGNQAALRAETSAAEEQLQKERREALRAQAEAMTAHRNGRGIDIMPGEGEESISSANGLTEADNADLDARNGGTTPQSATQTAPLTQGSQGPNDGFDASILFGMPSAEERAEAKATEKATKEGNDALARFAEEMPDDPMDLYQEQNPVNARKGGDDGNGPRYQPGYEKMSTEKAAEKKTLWQKISEGWHRLLRSMVNEADAIHQAGRRTGNRALDGMYFYAKAATQRAQQWIQGQRMNFDLSESGKGLNAIFDPIRAKGDEYYKNFQLYMYHMLNVERMSRSTADALERAQQRVNELAAVDPSIATMSDEQLRNRARQYQEQGGLGYEDDNRGELIYQYWQALQERNRAEKAQNKPVFGYDMDADESRSIARDLLAAHPEFEDLAQDVYDYVDALLQYRVDAGLITAEDMNRLKEMYPHYIPVMYKMTEEEVDDRHRKGNIQTDDAIRKAEGGDREMEPLHLALARQTLAVMKNAGYQQLGSEVLKEFRNNGEIMGRYVTNVKEYESAWDESLADNDDVNVPYENVISVFQDGKRFDLTLSDDMSYAFQSLQPSRQGNQDWKLMMKGNDLFKKLCTAYNPLFMITNPIRDVQDALFYSTDTKRWLRNYPRAIAQIAGNGRFWQMYQAMGGVNNSYFDWATGENSGKMGRIEALNMAIEQAPRLAEYMTVLENAQRNNGEVTLADRMEAFNAAAEITTNFSRGGTLGKWINRNLVPFWNPGVQGLSKAVRTVTETRGFKAWAGLTMKAAALGMLPALLNGLLYRDDDEWDTIDDQLKMEYYLFKTSDGVWIKVPKGRVLAALSMPVVGAQESMRGDEVDWKELTMQAFGSVAPNNPLETNLLSTAVQAKLFDADDPGKTWYGGDIESRRLQGYAPGERYDESTDVLSKWLGKQLNISPKKINYVIDQYSGILGDLVLPYLTPRAERGISAEIAGHDVSVPLSNAFMSRFTLDTVTNNTISGEYYDMLDELGFDAKSGDNPAAIAERYMNRAGSTVSDIYAQIREIENDTELNDREKTQLTRELRKQLNEYEKQVIEDAGKYLTSAREYMDGHPEFDYTDDGAVDAFVEGYNSMQTNEKYFIDAEQAAGKMKDEVYREVNREHFGAEYALQVYNKDVYEKARTVHDDSGLSYEDYYDYYFGTRYLFGDKDAEGNTIAGSRTDKVVNFLEGMDISDEQRNALYHAADHTWNYPTGITEYLKENPEYDFTDSQAVNAFVEGYNAQQSSEKYYIDAAGAKSKMRSEAYREIYREQYGAEYALEFFDKDVYEKAQELNTSAGLSYDDYYDFYFGTRYMYADKDENGNSISGSKKEKVVGFINDMDVSDAEKDALYLAAGYKENTLKTTPWNGGNGQYSSGGRSGGRGGRSSNTKAPKTKAVKGSGKIQLPKASSSVSRTGAGKSGTGGTGKGADASLSLIQIIDKYYGGNALAAAMDGGARARGRTTVDFEV